MEAAKGRREEEVIEEIGSPRLIAKTIIDEQRGRRGDRPRAVRTLRETLPGAGVQRPPTTAVFRSGTIAVQPPNFHYIDLNKWYWKAILSVVVIAILFVLFALVGGIFTILIHLAGPILLIWLIYTFIKSIWK
ncbi:MAG: hypothetical protein ACLR8P_16135 [Clostridium fessum]